MKRITLIAIAALTLAIAAAVATPNNANAAVRFGDGSVMAATISCNYGVGFSVSYYNSFGTGYAVTRIWNWQTARWIYDSGWVTVPAQFTGGWGSYWPYGHGRFTFRTVLARYINGQLAAGTDTDVVCVF